jgi:hypothetical protein
MILAKVPIVQRAEEGRGVTDLLYIARYTQLSGSLGGRIRYLVSTGPLCHQMRVMVYALVRSRHVVVAVRAEYLRYTRT